MGAAPRTVPVAVPVEDRLQFLLQQHRRRSLRHPVTRIGHAEQTHAFPMIFRYLHAPHRPREIAPRAHPVPQPVQIIPQLFLKQANANRVHARRAVVGPDLLPRPVNEALVYLKRLHLRLGPRPRLLPWRVGPGLTLVCTAPSLQPHYRTFLATTSRPAPVPRLGTLPLAVSAARGPPSRSQAGSPPVPWPPLSGRQVLLFRTSARDELTPPLHRAPPGQHAGHPLAEGTPPQRAFVPGTMRLPGFDAIVPPIDASAVVHTRSSSRRTPDPLTAGLFPQRSPPRLLTGAACGGLGSPPARRTRRTYLHHWHSTVHAGDLLHRLTPLSGHTHIGGLRACYHRCITTLRDTARLVSRGVCQGHPRAAAGSGLDHPPGPAARRYGLASVPARRARTSPAVRSWLPGSGSGRCARVW